MSSSHFSSDHNDAVAWFTPAVFSWHGREFRSVGRCSRRGWRDLQVFLHCVVQRWTLLELLAVLLLAWRWPCCSPSQVSPVRVAFTSWKLVSDAAHWCDHQLGYSWHIQWVTPHDVCMRGVCASLCAWGYVWVCLRWFSFFKFFVWHLAIFLQIISPCFCQKAIGV